MQNVLVTGADGFIGSHLAESLTAQGIRVRAFCQYNSFNSRGWLDRIDPGLVSKMEIVLGDIRDARMVQQALHGVDAVYHLAALIAIPYSYHAPESYVDVNIRGTLNVLEGARYHKTNRILVTSTSEVYGTAMYVPITEDHPRQAQSPYSATKIAADALAVSYYRSFGLPVTIVRPFNTYGPRQSARAIIPTIITQLLAGKQEIQLGDLRPTRDLVFVADTVKGFEKIAATPSLIGEDVNIATQAEISISTLAQELIGQLNPLATTNQEEDRLRPANSEVFRLLGSAHKLEQHTGWKPDTTLREGLVKTIHWFRNPDNIRHYRSYTYIV